MKINNQTQIKRTKDLAITAQLVDVLREVNLNASWKNGSTKFSKNRTGYMKGDTKFSNLMTEQDLDKLFNRSKQKSNLKTQIVIIDDYRDRSPKNRDFTDIQYLQLEDQYDKMLTGIPISFRQKQNIRSCDSKDLTLKFKKDYIVGKVIGEGAYASVRVAVFKPENRKIAIKAYEKVKIREPQRKKTVKREIKILQSVNHSNIVKIFDVVQTNNHVNIIMEYISGISLGTSLKQQSSHRLQQSHCKKICKSLAGALKYLHERNIAHRDIKLENIIVDQKLSPKLIDFGFSTCIEKGKKMKIFCGTPSYMAPEIVQKLEYRGEAADIWALGVLLFVMITGYFPYRGSTDEQLYRKINSADYPKQDIMSNKKIFSLMSRIFTLDPEERITASGILNHPWINEGIIEPRKNKNQHSDLKIVLSGSKEKSNVSCRPEDRSKSKKHEQPEKVFLKTTKDLTTMRRRFQKTTANPTKQEAYQSIKKGKHDNNVRIVDLLKFQLKKRSEEKSKCKSHRI